jgi:hypothetical protein
MLTAVLLLPFTINVVEQKRLGQARPLTYPVGGEFLFYS